MQRNPTPRGSFAGRRCVWPSGHEPQQLLGRQGRASFDISQVSGIWHNAVELRCSTLLARIYFFRK